ncbi:thermonuclease family protein [Lysinibacillus sp. UGB7]|uniref:thermonuclease family protein n=1 Tax=Lysinibacillus sp. UGB7 TaxID=3411039 RepID=UPI003B7F6EDF
MRSKQVLKISLLTLALSACGYQDNIDIENKQPISYEVNENAMSASNNKAVKESTVSNQIEVKYLWASDGDTAVFETIRGIGNEEKEQIKVRFLLIESPEMADKKTGKPQPYAEEAKARTTKLLESAKRITIEADEGAQYDKYGRFLGYVYVNDQSVQELLLKEGLAKVAVFPPNTRYLKEFEAAEAIAIKEGAGLWQLEN